MLRMELLTRHCSVLNATNLIASLRKYSPAKNRADANSENENKTLHSCQWRSNRKYSRFKEPGPPTVRGPDRGHNLFSLQDAKNQDSEKKQKSAQRRPCLLTAFIFLFPKTLTDSSDEELCNKLWLRSLATSRPIQRRSPISR